MVMSSFGIVGRLYTKQRISYFPSGFYTSIEDNGENKTCLAACESQSYQVSSSSSLYPVPTMFRYSPPFCSIVNKILSACQDERKTTLELAYPSICQQIITVKNYNACEEIFKPEKVTEWTNEQKEKFAKTVLRYTQENIVMVNIFMKDPFAQKILIQANKARYFFIQRCYHFLSLLRKGKNKTQVKGVQL